MKNRDKIRKPSTEKQRKNRKGRGREKKVADRNKKRRKDHEKLHKKILKAAGKTLLIAETRYLRTDK